MKLLDPVDPASFARKRHERGKIIGLISSCIRARDRANRHPLGRISLDPPVQQQQRRRRRGSETVASNPVAFYFFQLTAVRLSRRGTRTIRFLLYRSIGPVSIPGSISLLSQAPGAEPRGFEADKVGRRSEARTVLVQASRSSRILLARTENWFVRHQIAKIAEFYARPAISPGPIAPDDFPADSFFPMAFRYRGPR